MANPYATIVILTTGNPVSVLESLSKQTFQDFEVIIAKEKGIVNAMNLALKTAVGSVLVRIDDDVDLPESWLQELLMPFKDPYAVGVTGPTFVPEERRKNRDSIRIWEKPGRFLRWLQDDRSFAPAAIYKCGMVSYDSNYKERFCKTDLRYVDLCGELEPDHLEGTNWAMRTDLICLVGCFDPKFDGVSEWFDTDVEQKILKWGRKSGKPFRLVYNPRAYLWHMLDFTEHYNDRFDGLGRIKNWLRYHKRHSKFHWKMVVFLIVWIGYFILRRFKK